MFLTDIAGAGMGIIRAAGSKADRTTQTATNVDFRHNNSRQKHVAKH